MTRDEIEIAIFDSVDPLTPEDSWRAEVIRLACELDRLGALTPEEIEQMRDSRQRMLAPVEALFRHRPQ